MANKYFNPSAASDGTGALGSPWNLGASVVVATDDVLYIMRGTTCNDLRVILTGISNLKVTTYASDVDGSDDTTLAKPILQGYQVSTDTGNWVEPDSVSEAGLFKYDPGAGPGVILGYTTLGSETAPSWQGRANYTGNTGNTISGYATLDTIGDWDTNFDGSLYVFTDIGHTNPVTQFTNIYYAHRADCPFYSSSLLDTQSGLEIENIHFNNCLAGIYTGAPTATVDYSDVNIHHCKFEHCWTSISISSSSTGGDYSNAEIHHNEFVENGGTTSVVYRFAPGMRHHDNTITRTGRSDCIGAVYNACSGDIGNEIRIYNNMVDTTFRTTKTWTGEGFGLYLESTSANVFTYNNVIKNVTTLAGLHGNSGAADSNLWWWGNLIDNCNSVFSTTDGLGDALGAEYIYNNSGINLGQGYVSSTQPARAKVANLHNNIAYAGTGNGTTGIVSDDGIFVGTEGNNCVYGFDVDSSGITLTDPVLTDPLFIDEANGNYNLQKESPCVGVGIKYWELNPRPESLSGEPLPDRDIDLGAYQSTWSPNHPKNI